MTEGVQTLMPMGVPGLARAMECAAWRAIMVLPWPGAERRWSGMMRPLELCQRVITGMAEIS